MSFILAIDLGKYNSVFCGMQTATGEAEFRTAKTTQVTFIGTLRVLHCRLPECESQNPCAAKVWWQRLIWEIGQEQIEPRRNRINPRVVKHQVSNYAKKHPYHRPAPPPRKSFIESVVMTI